MVNFFGSFFPSSAQSAVDRTSAERQRWTQEEDNFILAQASQTSGIHDWEAISAALTEATAEPGQIGRTADAVRNHWHRLMKSRPAAQGFMPPPVTGGEKVKIDRQHWSQEEDRIICDGVMELGHKWREIAKRLPPCPQTNKHRTDSSVRNRWSRLSRNRQASPVGAADDTSEVLAVEETSETTALQTSMPPAMPPASCPVPVPTHAVPPRVGGMLGGVRHSFGDLRDSGRSWRQESFDEADDANHNNGNTSWMFAGSAAEPPSFSFSGAPAAALPTSPSAPPDFAFAPAAAPPPVATAVIQSSFDNKVALPAVSKQGSSSSAMAIDPSSVLTPVLAQPVGPTSPRALLGALDVGGGAMAAAPSAAAIAAEISKAVNGTSFGSMIDLDELTKYTAMDAVEDDEPQYRGGGGGGSFIRAANYTANALVAPPVSHSTLPPIQNGPGLFGHH